MGQFRETTRCSGVGNVVCIGGVVADAVSTGVPTGVSTGVSTNVQQILVQYSFRF